MQIPLTLHLRTVLGADILTCTDLVVASTRQEFRKQWPVLQWIRSGVCDHSAVIDIVRFYPFYHGMLSDTESDERTQ